MSNIDFTPTAFTVKDPGNGKERRYEAVHYPQAVGDAARVFTHFADLYPSLAALVVADHFIQLYCQAKDNASWSGGYGVSYETQQGIFLSLAEKGLGQARFN
jgi:hypothetical protein